MKVKLKFLLLDLIGKTTIYRILLPYLSYDLRLSRQLRFLLILFIRNDDIVTIFKKMLIFPVPSKLYVLARLGWTAT